MLEKYKVPWGVYWRGHLVDQIYFDEGLTQNQVYDKLVNELGYNKQVEVKQT